MDSLLIITALDCKQEANQRIHHVIKHIGMKFQNVTVMHFAQFHQKSLVNWGKEAFLFSVEEYWLGNVYYLRINPVANIPYAFGKGLLHFSENDGGEDFLRSFVVRTMNFLGLYKSISTAFCYFIAYFLKLRKATYDVVLVEGPWEGLLGVFLKAIKFTKTLIYQDFDYSPGVLSSKIRRIITEKIELFCMAKADLRISSGKMLKDLRQKKLKQPVIFIPNGVDYKYWSSAQLKKPHPPTLVYMGNIIDWTGIHWVLSVLPQIRKGIPDIRFVIIGQGHPAYLKKLVGIVKMLDIEECVQFAGFVPYMDLPAYLQMADIGIATFQPIPLLKYAFPLKVVEYMSARLPVITSSGTESACLVKALNCGMVVHYGNYTELKKAIESLLGDRAKYHVYAENSKKMSRGFDWVQLMDVQFNHMKQVFAESHRR